MKANRIELSALAAVSGPIRSKQEIETLHKCAELARISDHIAKLSSSERQERSAAAAAALANIASPADIEAVRAAFWTRSRLSARKVACMAANMPKERAEKALESFDAMERGAVHLALEKLIADLQNIQRCMNGGRMPKPAIGQGVH
ncbi:hypothetical protein [Lacisediminimonas profundi]|uniref:hypothetical protein n=1 Tax=Lacisediminimonas profundi TaxID=2603856 RepID=UPI00124B286C|nr:hypothetical protein [Lacisediminimonas profundi]